MWKTERSYCSSIGSRKSSTCGFGVDRSMWHRQIHLAPFSAACIRNAAGWGSWITMKSYSSDRPPTFIRLYFSKIALSASLSSRGSPCSELCICLVTWKNSSRPYMTFQSAFSPASFIRGTRL